MEPVFAVPKTQWDYLAIVQSIILFGRGKSMLSSVIDVLSPNVTPVYFLTAEN